MMIPLRPHHLLCTLSYSGHGYSEEFTARMDELTARLRAGEEPTFRLQISPDYLCEVCPNRTENGCESDEKVLRYDRKTLDALGLCESEIDYAEAKRLLREKLTDELLRSICGDCEWRELCSAGDMLKNLG